MSDQTKIVAVVATPSTSNNQFQYAPEVLQQLADKSAGVPITMDFDKEKTVGVVSSAEFDGNGVSISGILFDKFEKYMSYYLVPGIIVDSDTKEFIAPFAFGLTQNPVDKTIPVIKRDDE